ncbi:MAG: ANTAR domain-containing protein [Acidimicrobiales bacterium]
MAEALRPHAGPPVLERLLALCVELLTISGATVAIVAEREHLGTVAVSAPRWGEIEELQFELGEGPTIDTGRYARPTLEPDLTQAVGRWPAFAPAAMALHVHATFAFPLQIGAVRLGVLTLYRVTPGTLASTDLNDAVELTHITTHLMLDAEASRPPGTLSDRLNEVASHRAHVHQATGMIAAQLDSDVATALLRLRAFAWSVNRSIDDVSGDVIARKLRFDTA